MTESMKVVRIHKYGGPRVLTYEDAPRPEPKEDELFIRVHAAGVNPADWQIRSGRRFKLKKPFSLILGADVSGVVEVAGSSVTDFKVGDAVYGMVDIRKGGAYAEYVSAPAANFASKPTCLDHIQAAALPVAALTAWQALFEAGELSAGQKVLIHAAAGGVGHIAVQLAKWKGAYVIGTASGRNENFLGKIGVNEFVNYRTTLFEKNVRDVDVVLECINRDIAIEAYPGQTLERSWSVLKKSGVLVSICTNPSPETATDYGVRGKYILARPDAAQLTKIAMLADAGHVEPTINTVLPLKDAHKAHKISKKGHTRGKIVLQVVE
ncbi:MAG: NADP-dependent oxidoreductase [Planctomycetota bacterium]|jgi:NADPH:quinone reductase-like Zn-dependent oxidoreductase